MATPAARPNFQLYTAGSCTLEVEVQPSALSQWSARPIVKELSFRLWLHDEGEESEAEVDRLEGEVDGARRLIASGDRTALQVLAQYFQQQTQQVLAIAALSRTRQATALPSPKSLQIIEPLGYLQLCDITTVIGQYEQTMRTLPVALDAAPSVEIAQESAREAAPNPSNVISFDVRRQRRVSTDRRPTTRKRRTGAWASSAAAALFVVGLTTTLISRDPALQESNVVSDTVIEGPQEGFALEGGEAQTTTPAESPESSISQEPTDNLDPAISESADANESTISRDAQADTTRQPEIGSRQPQTTAAIPPSSPAPPSSPVSPSRSVDRVPATGSDTTTTQLPETQPDDLASSTSNAEAEDLPQPSPPEEVAPSPAASAEPSTSDTTEDSDFARRPAAELPQVEQEARVERAASEPFSPPPTSQPPTPTGGASSSRISIPPADNSEAQPEVLRRAAGRTALPSSAIATNQVQTYFQQRWQTGERGPLAYRLQLNSAGEVISFIGLDDASQAERDRILPTDTPPTFEPSSLPSSAPSNESLVLRVQLNQDGTVEVTTY